MTMSYQVLAQTEICEEERRVDVPWKIVITATHSPNEESHLI